MISVNYSQLQVMYSTDCMHARMFSSFSRVQLSVTLWTIACQSPLSMGFSRQGYWSGLPCPFPGDLPDPRIEPMSLMSPESGGGFFTTNATWEAPPRKARPRPIV